MKKTISYVVIGVVLAVIVGVVVTPMFDPLMWLNVDMFYHLARVHQLDYWFNGQGLFPQNFNSFGGIGIAVNMFYPWQVLGVFAALTAGVSGILSQLQWILALMTFATSVLAFVAAKWAGLKKLPALLFALLYTFQVHVALEMLTSGSFSTAAGTMFIPFAFFGLYRVLAKQDFSWSPVLMMAVGGVGMAYAHLMTFLIVHLIMIIAFIVVLIISPQRRHVFMAGLRYAVLLVPGALAVLGPIVYLQMSNVLKAPASSILAQRTYNISDFVLKQPGFESGLMLAPLLLLLFLFRRFYQDKLAYVLVVVGVGMFLMSTNIFPWNVLQNTPIAVIQMPARLLLPSLALLEVIVFMNESEDKVSTGIILVLTALAVFNGAMAVDNFAKGTKHLPELTTAQIDQFGTGLSDGYGVPETAAITEANTREERFWLMMNYSDYMPKAALTNKADNLSFIGNDQNGLRLLAHDLQAASGAVIKPTKVKITPQTMTLTVPSVTETGQVKLPVLGYNKLPLVIKVDGKLVPSRIVAGQWAINAKLLQGKTHTVTISQQTPIWLVIMSAISLVWPVVIIATIIWRKVKK